MGRKPDIPHFVGCKSVQTRRLAGRVPSTMAITNIDNHIPKSRHRGWSTHLASRRYRLAQPKRTSSRSFVTPGGIGTHRMHPPGKRNHRDSNITSGNHKQFDTHGQAQRPFAEFIYENHHNHFVTSVTSRCAVECGVGGPQAGHSTFRWLQASQNSAAGRAGTVHDGHHQLDNHIPKSRHRGWSTHLASRRYRLAQPNRISSRSFITPGGIGTHRMHPPRKRNHRDSNITRGNHTQFDTREQASAPARWHYGSCACCKSLATAAY